MWLKDIAFTFLMWLNRGERRGYEAGYWRGWCNALHAVRSGEVQVQELSRKDSKQQPYPVYAPLEVEPISDKLPVAIADISTQELQRIGSRLFRYLQEKHGNEEAGPETRMHRALHK